MLPCSHPERPGRRISKLGKIFFKEHRARYGICDQFGLLIVRVDVGPQRQVVSDWPGRNCHCRCICTLNSLEDKHRMKENMTYPIWLKYSNGIAKKISYLEIIWQDLSTSSSRQQ